MVDLFALGPLELRHGGERRSLGPLMNRRVLAVLLHARNKPVSTEALAERIWGEAEPGANFPETLRTYISRLRKRLKAAGGEGRLQLCPPGRYRLVVRPEEVDLLRFDRLRDEARAALGRGDTDRAMELLLEAESLWRGEPLTEFTSEWATSVRTRLHEHLLWVKEQRIALALDQGEHAELIGELQELVAQNPFAQQAVYFLMSALYRNGRHADSLRVYQETYRRFAEELGTQPSARLQRLNRQILEQDPALDLAGPPVAAEAVGARGPASSPAPEQSSARTPERGAPPPSVRTGSLPPDIRDFTGRASELAVLLGDFGPPSDDVHAAAPPVHVLYGMAGIGKTVTAVRAARRMADRFPDGVHYVDLRGYSDERCDPHEALATLLRTSGAATELPDSVDERTARWREWTARHVALVVLDNAYSPRQVTPLLPVSPSCRAIITSRSRLPGLDGATDLPLEALSSTEATDLFRRAAGASRTTDEAALIRIVDACGRHPLALQLLAGRYRARASWDLEYLHRRLQESHDPLTEFHPVLAQAFQFTYAELQPRARLLLRRLALHTGPVFSLGAVSALLGTDPSSTRPTVESLLDACFLTEGGRDYYSLHDLVRVFAAQTCRRDEPETVARSASHRLLSYYLHSADHADRVAHPHRRRLRVLEIPSEPPVHAEEFSDPDAAMAWLDLEKANLLSAARTALETARHHVPRFAHVLAPTLELWGVRHFAARLHSEAIAELRDGIERRALAQALTERADILAQERPSDALDDASEALVLSEELSDATGCADALLQTGRSHVAVGRSQEALVALHRALGLYRDSGDLLGQAHTLNVQAVALHYQGAYRAAEERFLSIIPLAKQLENPLLESKAINNLGDLALHEERYGEAREYFERARDLKRQFGGVRGRAIVECNLASIYKIFGEPERALSALRRALDTYREGGDTSGEADTLVTLGETYAGMNRFQEALLHFHAAEEVSRTIQNGYEQQRALIGIADIQRASGRLRPARETYERALRLSQAITYPLGSARALDGLARTALSAPGGTAPARAYAQQAVDLYERLGSPAEAAALRHFLSDVRATGS